MTYKDYEILRDKKNYVIPQYFKEGIGFLPLSGRYGSTDFVQKGTVAEESWQGNTTETRTFTSDRFGFAIINDGTADLTFEINGQTRRVKPGESYDSLFNSFTSVSITATSYYRAEVLS